MTDIRLHEDKNIIHDNTDYRKLYLELIYEIKHVPPKGKSCHEVALMHIRQAENQNNPPQCAKST